MGEARVNQSFISPLDPFSFEKERGALPFHQRKENLGLSNIPDHPEGKVSELFPNIQRILPLPEEAAKVDTLDTPSFRAPREKPVLKPTLPMPEWTQAKPATTTTQPEEGKPSTRSWLSGLIPWNREKKEEPLIGTHRKPEEKPSTKSWFSGLIPWNQEKQEEPLIGAHRKPEEKPASSWVRGEKPQTPPQQSEPLIGMHRRMNYQPSFQKDKDPFADFPNQGGAVLAKLIGLITDGQFMMQSSQLEVFGATHKSLEEVRQKQLELLKEMMQNSKEGENWSYRKELLEYLGIAIGMVGGATMIGTGMATGGASIAPGAKMLAGGGIALGAKLAGDYFKDYSTYTSIIGLGGNLLSGWGLMTGSAALGSVNKTLAAAGNLTFKISEFLIGRKHTETQSKQYGTSARNVTLKYEREERESTMRKIVGGFKSSKESCDLLNAGSRALRTEAEIKSRMAQPA